MLKLSKAAQRRGALDRRQSLSAIARREMSAAICAAAANMDVIKRAGTVMSYNAFGYEADMAALHRVLRSRGVRLCFPVCSSATEMDAYEPEDPRALISGRFCIAEPDPARSVRIPPEEIDAVIVPCAAFDAGLRRIGQGAGYYDRFLPKCRNASFIAAAFSVQRVDQVSAGEHDVAMHAVITEARIYRQSSH